MAQVLQASCPGCKSVLRFPPEWLGQAVRCKQCKTVLQCKGSAVPPLPLPAKKSPASVSAKTPAPKPRPAKPAPPPAAIAAPSPVAAAPPMAVPVAAGGDPFAFDGGGGNEDAPSVRKRRRGNGTAWVGLGLTVALIAATVGLGTMFWPKIKKALQEEHRQVAMSDDKDETPAPVKSRKDAAKEDTPPADKNGKPVKDKEKPVVVTKDKDKAPKKDKSSLKDGKPKKDKDKVVAVVKDKDKAPTKDKDKARPKDPPPVKSGLFPRRALIVSVHNYLYANPVMPGQQGAAAVPGGRDLAPGLVPALNQGLHIPLTQIYHVSDLAKKEPLPPLKPVIEQSIQNFLATSREQDRILLFFIGHAKEIGDKAYLVPIEGDFKDPTTLIPLEWLYQKLAECKARQKILVIDGNRYNAAQGEERPTAGEMGEKFEAMLKAPPAGVEVFSACSKGQQSNEFENEPLGLFLAKLRQALRPEGKDKSALDGKMQKPDDLIPLARLGEFVAAKVAAKLEKRKQKQTPFVAGKPPGEGAPYDKDAALAKEPAFPKFEAGSQQAVKDILAEVSVPPVKGGKGHGADLNFAALPPFSAEALKKYDSKLPADNKVRVAIHQARVVLWAASPATAPSDLQGEVTELRKRERIKDIDSITRDKFNNPGAMEKQFKAGVKKDSTDLARVVFQLEEVESMMKETAESEEFKAAPLRWQANFIYVRARVQAQLTYLEEYNNLLGGLLKELPPTEANATSGWRMAAKEKATDTAAKRYFKALRASYAELIKNHKGTPWEVLGKREELTALGLEWQAF